MKQEKHQFGFIFAQSPTPTINRQSIEKSCSDFIAEVTPHLAQACKLPEEKIISDFYFDKRTNEVKGMIKIPEPAKESVIDQLYYYGKAAWRNQKSEPYDFHLFIAD